MYICHVSLGQKVWFHKAKVRIVWVEVTSVPVEVRHHKVKFCKVNVRYVLAEVMSVRVKVWFYQVKVRLVPVGVVFHFTEEWSVRRRVRFIT